MLQPASLGNSCCRLSGGEIRRLNQLAKCRVERRDPGQGRRIRRDHLEVLKIESGTDCASHQAVFTARLRRLPAARGNHTKRTTIRRTARECLFVHAILIINPVEDERIAFMEMPRLIGSDPVPPAVLAFNKQKVDRRQRRPRRSLIQRLHLVRRPEDLPEVSAFRMRLQTQLSNQFPCPVVHSLAAIAISKLPAKNNGGLEATASCSW